MGSEINHHLSLVKLLLPEDIFDYFEIINIDIKDKEVYIDLDELNIPPEGFKEEKLISKGFHSSSTIQDFPLRDKAMFLRVRRRRWLIESTGKVISRDWEAVAKGTRLTKGFANFLKGILGQLPDKQQ